MLGIIGAMDIEVEALYERMTETEVRTIAGMEFHKGKLEGRGRTHTSRSHSYARPHNPSSTCCNTLSPGSCPGYSRIRRRRARRVSTLSPCWRWTPLASAWRKRRLSYPRTSGGIGRRSSWPSARNPPCPPAIPRIPHYHTNIYQSRTSFPRQASGKDISGGGNR